ncbi:MAG TPA: chemotaxis protein CheW [Candidatus Eisenbacteria bacterium]|nr:chemotaxis protein CheW [Candidatus Eisenbacteria bacterium]
MRNDAMTKHGTRGVLVFAVGDVYFGAHVEEVAGLIDADRLAPLPRQHGALAGVVAFRGAMVPVLDLCAVLDYEWPSPSASRYAIVLARGPERFALLIPSLPRIVSARDLKESDPSDEDGFGSLVESVYQAGDKTVHCLTYWSIFESIVTPAGANRAGRGLANGGSTHG